MNDLMTAFLFCFYLSVPAAIFALFVGGSKRRLGLGVAAALAVVGVLGAVLVRTLLI